MIICHSSIRRIKTEEEKQRLENEIEDLKKDRDCGSKECEDLKVELSLSEDRYENIKIQLAETNHKLKESKKIDLNRYSSYK